LHPRQLNGLGVGKSELLETRKHVLGLEDINIEMQPSQITVIMGLSGSGKSTLIRHINRLIEPTDGVLEIDGVDVTGLSDDALREMRQQKMSMVFQKFALLPHRTVLENAMMPLLVRGVAAPEARKEAVRWLDRVGLGGFENRPPSALSGGMQQRVGIARALTSGSEIMLMDEAFSALDPIIRTDMQTLLLELQAELHKTVVFITHDLDEALRLADHLVVLKDGRIVQQGEPQDIILKPEDDYIRNFVRDVNRARVIRVRSVMQAGEHADAIDGDVGPDDTIEDLIRLSGGDPDKRFRVCENAQVLGRLDMRSAYRALVA